MSTLQQHFQNLHLIIQRGRTQASAAATVYALETYWNIGAYLSHRLSESTYGKRVVQEFADWLQTVEPGIKGYDWRSLYRMREFFEQWHNMDWTIAGHTHVAMLSTQSTEDDFPEKILGSAIPKMPEMPALLTRISWTHHLELLKRCTSPEEIQKRRSSRDRHEPPTFPDARHYLPNQIFGQTTSPTPAP